MLAPIAPDETSAEDYIDAEDGTLEQGVIKFGIVSDSDYVENHDLVWGVEYDTEAYYVPYEELKEALSVALHLPEATKSE